MFEYNFSREIVAGAYNVNNQYYVDGNLDVIPLCCDIETALSKDCNIKCADTAVVISFETELSGGEQTTLDTTVSTYKAITE